MKTITTFLILFLFHCIFPLFVSATDITALEYYYDIDPGMGNGTAVTITPGSDITKSFIADLSSVDFGFHILYVRGKDENGLWGIPYVHPFLKAGGEITHIEYYFDADPGMGSGTAVSFTPGRDVTVNFSPDLSGVSKGQHILYIRGRDENGSWGISHLKPFYMVGLTSTPDITYVEYFIDTDPGRGSSTPVPFSPHSQDVNLNFTVDLTNVSAGAHKLYVRAKDSNDDYTIVYVKDITVIDPDTDDDGLPDDWELLYFGNLDETATGDFDSDGLNNLGEYENNTLPDNPDTDNDQMPDGWEVLNHLNPLINDAGEDPDHDGISNLDEYQNGTNPRDSQVTGVLPAILLLLNH